MSIKGITKRWIIGSLVVTILILAIVVISFTLILKGYFYNGIEQLLSGHSSEIGAEFSRYSFKSQDGFNDKILSYIENFIDKDTIQIIAYDNNDRFIGSSDGFIHEDNFSSDVNKKNFNNCSYKRFIGYLPSREHIISVTKDLCSSSGEYIGAIKYTVSLKKVDNKILKGVLALCFLSLIVTMIVVFTGIYFIRSIINPVTEITNTAKLIAQGNFTIKIEKKYDDEVGELCDTINYMAEELGIAEKMKNDFISSVSHEIRTPLTAIKGWAETMQIGDGIDKSVIKKGLYIIVNETERLSGIVEELLDFSRLQSGRLTMSMDKLDILAELGEAVYMFKEKAISENKTLIYNEPKMLPPIIGDRNRLKQVFINIIDNAVKYTSENGGIGVSVTEKSEGISVNVTDNGCGISKEHLPKIKEKFYKANNLQRGSGIGLAIANEIIEMHGGKLNIVSEEGFGTSVNIFLPFIKNESEVID